MFVPGKPFQRSKPFANTTLNLVLECADKVLHCGRLKPWLQIIDQVEKADQEFRLEDYSLSCKYKIRLKKLARKKNPLIGVPLG
jgi:hypothetical protein